MRVTERAVVDLQRGRGSKVGDRGLYDRLLHMYVSLQRVQWNLLCFGLGKPVYTRNSSDSERELSLRRHCTRTKNTIDTCINSDTDRFLHAVLPNSVILRNVTAITPFKVIQGHQVCYQSKAHMRLPISD